MDVLALIIVVVFIMYLMQVGFPRSARQLSASRTFLRFYFHRIFSSWVLLGIAGIILLHDGIPLSSIGLLLPNPWWPTLLAFVGVGILFSLLMVIYLRTMSEEQLVAKLAREKLRLALPRTSSKRLAWVGVSINTGVWEEIVFRGFLPWYVVHHLTFFGLSVPFVWAAIFSLILFSLAHLYQGWGGVLRVGFLGITLTLLYALTGNLLASILSVLSGDELHGNNFCVIWEERHEAGSLHPWPGDCGSGVHCRLTGSLLNCPVSYPGPTSIHH